jgi:hypothetical protein
VPDTASDKPATGMSMATTVSRIRRMIPP